MDRPLGRAELATGQDHAVTISGACDADNAVNAITPATNNKSSYLSYSMFKLQQFLSI